MDAPKTKDALLSEMAAGRKEWLDLIAQISDEQMKQPGVDGIWSIKEILAHICAYEQYMAAMLADQKGDGGSETAALDSFYQIQLSLYRMDHPNLPEQVQDLRGDQVNEMFAGAYRFKRPAEVRKMEEQAYQKLEKWVDQYSDAELTAPFTNTGATLMQVIPRQCYSHYRTHASAIRAWLDQQKKAS